MTCGLLSNPKGSLKVTAKVGDLNTPLHEHPTETVAKVPVMTKPGLLDAGTDVED
jgi:hypothetical protein